MTPPHGDHPLRKTWQSYLGCLLLVALLLPPVRHASEASMTAHMLLQYSGLLLAGGWLAHGVVGPAFSGWRRRLHDCNELGVAGLLYVALTLAVLMVPRVLDLALVDLRIEGLKFVALLMAGMALRLSWRRAGVVVQAFFLGHVLPMMVVVGTLYQDAPARVCNAYRLDDQQTLGMALCWISGAVAALWLLHLGLQRRATARDATPSGPSPA